MSAKPMTYAEVRDFVTGIIGPSCEMEATEMVVFYANCLNQMWVDLKDSLYFHAQWNFTLLPGQPSISLPADVWRIESVMDPILCTELEEIEEVCKPTEIAPPTDDCLPCNVGKWANVDKPIVSSPVSTVKPSGFWIKGGSGQYSLHFDPVPQTECKLAVSGQRHINCVLWDDNVSADGSKVRTWRNIDLPVQYHSIFAKCVVSMSYAACDDPSMAQFWMSLAANEMAAIIGTGDTLKTTSAKPLRMYSGGDKSDCPSSFKFAPRFIDGNGVLSW